MHIVYNLLLHAECISLPQSLPHAPAFPLVALVAVDYSSKPPGTTAGIKVISDAGAPCLPHTDVCGVSGAVTVKGEEM